MTPIYQNNSQILDKRWPEVGQALLSSDWAQLQLEIVEKVVTTAKVNGIQLSSAYDPIEEAFTYRSLTSGDDYHVWGLGLGHVIDLLSSDKNAKSINIYIYNLELSKLVFSLIPCHWLADPRVNLCLVDEKHPNFMQHLSNLGHPGSIVINSDKAISKSSHQWLYFRMENTVVMRHVHRNQLQNDDKFLQIENDNFSLLKNMPSIDTYLGYNIKNAICIGAGPSLSEHISELKEYYCKPNRPTFIAAATACKCLLENGIKPDVVFAIDIDIPDSYIPFEIANNTILVFASRLSKRIFSQWHGEKYYLHLADETYDRFNDQLPTIFRPFIYGSVIHPLIHTTLLQGAKDIKLIGCDFGFPNEIIHASMENNPDDHNSSMGAWVENGHGELIKTSPTYRMFATGVENLISIAPETKFYNWSRMGAKIMGTEYLDLEKSYA